MESNGDGPLESAPGCAELEREVRLLRDRLAFYEGFDQLIQDNVAHARELMRTAALEREGAAAHAERSRSEAGQREARHRTELEAIAEAIEELSEVVAGLYARVSRALAGLGDSGETQSPPLAPESPLALVAHGVPSARSALSLQRFVASLPQVVSVTAREYAEGVLRLDATIRDPLRIDQLRAWDESHHVDSLTERHDVIEIAVRAASG